MERSRIVFTRSPLKGAGVLLGIGMGSLAYGIVFRQILQLHNMVSGRVTPNSLPDLERNLFWDGMFQAFAWVVAALGVVALWRAGKRPDVPWRKNALIGSMAVGWGLFILAEGLINHQVIQLHHVIERAAPGWQIFWDIVFLLVGVALTGFGTWLIGKDDREARGELGIVTPLRPPRAG